ncbi:hypothetical protein ACHAQA_000973 [Verticillium albo-atrum]
MEDQVDLAEYLFRRLVQIGVGSVHGVPGDYNLVSLDYIQPAGLHWVGNANELNAGYAADGYARIKGVSAITTSFGVGELSAINAIAGAYAEKAAVVHIVGMPPRAPQNAGACLHHSLGDGNFRVFADMYKSVTVAQANLTDPSTAPRLIDETLKQCLLQNRPVYIELPSDMVTVKVPPPTTPIDLSVPGFDESFENQVVQLLLAKLSSAKRPLILVDGFTARYDIRTEINEFVQQTGIPTLTTPFGKSIVKETLPSYCGVYSGLIGDQAHHQWVDGCDLVFHFGPLRSDINTLGFTALTNPKVTVSFDRNSIHWDASVGPSMNGRAMSTKSLLKKLSEQLRTLEPLTHDVFPEIKDLPRNLLRDLAKTSPSSPVDQYTFWLRMSQHFRPGDILLTETGTSSYGGQSFVLPEDTVVINSSIWLSIGYMLAACQGAALAQREMVAAGTRPQGRTILFEGEGSLQMSAQAISDMIRNRLDVTIFVLNNSGYTIERLIHGFNANYNDIQPWRNLEAPSYFGAPRDDPSYPVRTRRIDTWGDLEAVLQDADIQAGKGLNVIEVFMGMGDAPEPLKRLAEYVGKRNRGAA